MDTIENFKRCSMLTTLHNFKFKNVGNIIIENENLYSKIKA